MSYLCLLLGIELIGGRLTNVFTFRLVDLRGVSEYSSYFGMATKLADIQMREPVS